MPKQNDYDLIVTVKPTGAWWKVIGAFINQVIKLEAKVATQQIQIEHYKAREWLWRKLGALGS